MTDLITKAREILEKFVEIEAYRDDLCVNDLPFLQNLIAAALEAERKAGFDERKELIEQEFRRGVAEGYRRGLEEAAEIAKKCDQLMCYCAERIRGLAR